jgi:16S rRNA (uracil1498-N3)-methyltransferase
VEKGEPIEVLDLAGTVAVATFCAFRPDGSCEVEIKELVRERGEPPVPVTLALAILHTQAFDWAVEKATELGATRIQPLYTERVQGRKHEQRVARWQRIAEAAVAQCGRSRPPAVCPPLPLREFLAAVEGAVFVADPRAQWVPHWDPVPPAGVTVVVGPEGGFTEGEKELMAQAGATGLFLGPRTLRAETAAVVALSLVQAQLGWWTNPPLRT